MKRDWDLVRQIMLAIEELPPGKTLDPEEITGAEPAVVAHHMLMMDRAGLINGTNTSVLIGDDYIARGLTWQGHELLDQIRNTSVWSKIKATAQAKGISLTIEAIKLLAESALKAILGDNP